MSTWRLPPLNLQPNKNIWISAGALIGPYLGIFIVIFIAEKSGFWLGRLAALPLIAAFQNHLQILLHEGAHFQLHPKKSRNDFLADLFCGLPFFGFVRHYRFFHFQHHRYLLDPEKDPEIEFYAEQHYFFESLDGWQKAKMIFYDVSGFHALQFFFSYNFYLYRENRAGRMAALSKREKMLLGIVVISMLGTVLWLDAFLKFLFYWVLPQFTILFLFLKLQGYGEHSKRTAKMEEFTYNRRVGLLSRFFIYPYNSQFHLVHHQYPSVPWYRLPKIDPPRGGP